jgi:Endosomal/lysosomal potassium channel TMEM175
VAEAAGRGPEAGRDRDRIVNLSDGVFAIAITLLVLDIRVPDIPEDMVASELGGGS